MQGEAVFAGHPIAAVVGDSPEAASDGLSRIEVDYEILPVVSDIEKALCKDATLVWEKGIPRDESDVSSEHADVDKKNEDFKDLPRNVHSQNLTSHGNVENAFKKADLVLERVYKTAAVHQGYIEPQNCVVVPDLNQELTIYTSTQGPKSVHKDVARLLNLPFSKIRVVPMVVGGGFGGKLGLLEPTAAAIAIELKMPVKMELSRSDDFMTSTPAPPCRVYLKMGAMKDGTLTALDATIDVDNGVYAAASWSSLLALLMAIGYRIPNYRIRGHEVITQNDGRSVPRSHCANSCFVIESHIDDLMPKLISLVQA